MFEDFDKDPFVDLKSTEFWRFDLYLKICKHYFIGTVPGANSFWVLVGSTALLAASKAASLVNKKAEQTKQYAR